MGVAKPGIPATDILLFVFHTDENEDPTDLITFTQHKVGEVMNQFSIQLLIHTYTIITFMAIIDSNLTVTSRNQTLFDHFLHSYGCNSFVELPGLLKL